MTVLRVKNTNIYTIFTIVVRGRGDNGIMTMALRRWHCERILNGDDDIPHAIHVTKFVGATEPVFCNRRCNCSLSKEESAGSQGFFMGSGSAFNCLSGADFEQNL